MQIICNNKPRLIIYGFELSEKQKLEFDCLDDIDSNQFFKYKNEIVDVYLDYLNNFLTVERFAVYYDVDVEFANKILELGRFYMSKGEIKK
jgi:hypothetical protein